MVEEIEIQSLFSDTSRSQITKFSALGYVPISSTAPQPLGTPVDKQSQQIPPSDF